MQKVIERFLKYVKVDTQSLDDMEQVPSTEKQKNLAAILVEELIEIGAADVKMDDHCYVYATIPATTDKKLPVLGLIAHMDTSNAISGENVKPQIIQNYDGKSIVLNKELSIFLDPSEHPSLINYIGQDLIVTDGTTLLGADDKAGVAEIMTLAEYLLNHPEIKHGTIKIGFTPDEEVGRGVDFFDVEGFGADFAYTVDGGELGEIEYENFNAAGGKVEIQGKSIHPGSAKDKMLNALLLAMEFQSMLPVQQNPMYTENYEGFFMLSNLEGGVDFAKASYIIRDHDKVKFEEKKARFLKIGDYLNDKYGEGTFTVTVKDSYYNMKEKIEPHIHLIDNAKLAMEELGVTPIVVPIRGGTDGARLSYMGLPCPNLCTGGHNYHGRYEYISIQSMEKVVEILLKLVESYSK
ncbi:peptidase T [Anaerocolumna cellulosilytica]|uniref:Peptidase T n=1 Tax=Anaerocolumna cellulosilytica TaxID=433286 RepID=A0A6S6QTD6_9FIRM|nr:peptidase T [Anaerocolumna cellulosilytica]MBB5194215.1 tripeptide aminopeptidase [Anaerocolumna cellulosilytica]BCJ94573.1 peptidase T [Anaerocolumna cellulosilytica]